MCGIFGYFCASRVNMQKVLELLSVLEKHQYRVLGEQRPVGGHGAGVCFADNADNLSVHKVGKTNASPARDLSLIKDISEVSSRIVLGHVRYASLNLMHTIGYPEAAQPYKVNCFGLSEVVSAHNGKVRNYNEIKNSLSRNHCFQSETVDLVDSEVIPHLFEESLMIYNDQVEARKRTFKTIKGNNTIVLLTRWEGKGWLHILHIGSTRGMHVWKNDEGEIILCSRDGPVQLVFRNLLKKGRFEKVLSIKWKERRKEQKTYKIVDF